MRRTLLIVSLLAMAGCWGGGDQLTGEVRVPVPPESGEKGVIVFRPPRGWQAYRADELSCEVAFLGPKAEGYNSHLTLFFQQNDEQLNAYADKLTEELATLFSQLEVEKSGPAPLGNVDGWQIVTRYKSADLEVRCMRNIFFTEGWKVSLTFHCLARDFSDFEGLFSDCVNSFRWIKGQAPPAPGQGN